MITRELKSKIDSVWDDFWSGGISNPLEVMEQLTYLLFERLRALALGRHPIPASSGAGFLDQRRTCVAGPEADSKGT